jgi:hypothetical protein
VIKVGQYRIGIIIPHKFIRIENKNEVIKFIGSVIIKMVPNIGFELITYRLQGGCSTVELIRRIFKPGSEAEKIFFLKKIARKNKKTRPTIAGLAEALRKVSQIKN